MNKPIEVRVDEALRIARRGIQRNALDLKVSPSAPTKRREPVVNDDQWTYSV
jgi:hypothetical protein